MPFLLDTHIWLWMLADTHRLPTRIRSIIENPEAELFLSAASLWEISIKQRLSKLELADASDEFFHDRMIRTAVSPLEISMRHALAAGRLPDIHRDPFDRMLVAQAQTHDLTILTVDEKIAHYDVRTVSD